MKIVIDITHPAHINFFKKIVFRLRENGHSVILTCLGRGKVPEILKKELPDFQIIQIGGYSKGIIGLYFRTGLFRLLLLLRFLCRAHPDIVLAATSFQIAMLKSLFRFRSLGVSDDPEHKLNFQLSKRFLDCFLIPESLGIFAPGIVTFRGLKEWAYLSPTYFNPKESTLIELGLEKRRYIFIREVETASLNYRSQKVNTIQLLYDQGLDKDFIVLSLEDKRRTNHYTRWKILEEPVSDIHSLMYYSKLVISNGDSMAREGAQLGVPSIYCGQRIMKANKVLVDLGFMQHITSPEAILKFIYSAQLKKTEHRQDERRNLLLGEWDDPNEVVYQNLMNLAYKEK